MERVKVPTLLITGPVGVGKTAVGGEISEMLDEANVPHAFVDLDALGWCYPRPAEDPYRSALTFRNLAAVWANDRAAGAQRLVLARVLEDRTELERYREAVPGAEITVVRLRAERGTLLSRLGRRELASALGRHQARAAELAAQMDAGSVEDLLVETDDRTVSDIAREILTRTAWLP